jgi:hypothetical protein
MDQRCEWFSGSQILSPMNQILILPFCILICFNNLHSVCRSSNDLFLLGCLINILMSSMCAPLHLYLILLDLYILKIEATDSSELLVPINQASCITFLKKKFSCRNVKSQKFFMYGKLEF